jgi:hypothetical protein
MVTRVDGRPIEIGYPWRVRLRWTVAMLPTGAQVGAHVRAKRADATILGTLTTANGGLVIVSETDLDVVMPEAVTALLQPGVVVVDFVRTDLVPHEHMGVELTIPVWLPVTRGLP